MWRVLVLSLRQIKYIILLIKYYHLIANIGTLHKYIICQLEFMLGLFAHLIYSIIYMQENGYKLLSQHQ